MTRCRERTLLAACLLVPLLAACSWDEPVRSENAKTRVPVSAGETRQPAINKPVEVLNVRHKAASIAMQQTGSPYLYGGRSPNGFDCSGLIWYAYDKVGVSVPRTTSTLWQQLTPIPSQSMNTGDVLFFNIEGKPSHVGLYLGDRKFVHAPSTGKHVVVASIDSAYYARTLVRVGRVND